MEGLERPRIAVKRSSGESRWRSFSRLAFGCLSVVPVGSWWRRTFFPGHSFRPTGRRMYSVCRTKTRERPSALLGSELLYFFQNLLTRPFYFGTRVSGIGKQGRTKSLNFFNSCWSPRYYCNSLRTASERDSIRTNINWTLSNRSGGKFKRSNCFIHT